MLTEKILVQIKFRETSTLIKHWSGITLGSYSANKLNHSGKIIFLIIHNVGIRDCIFVNIVVHMLMYFCG